MKYSKAFISIAILFLISIHLLHAHAKVEITAGISLDSLKRYEKFIEAEIEEGNIPGAISLIVRNGETVNSAAFGFSDIDKKLPMKMDNIFSIQSMTKPIITVARMMLFEEGYFHLTDLVSMYLPAFKNVRVIKNADDGRYGETASTKSEITMLNLLTHTAGFSYGFGSSKLDRDFKEMRSQSFPNIKAKVDSTIQILLVGQPGEQ